MTTYLCSTAMSSKKNDEDIQYQPIKEGTFLEVDPKRGVGGGGKVEILREKNTSRYASRSKAPYILHFIDFHVNNPHNSDLYVFLTHDKNGASKKMKRVDNRDTIVYLENGNGGRVRGPGARGTFSQELNGVTDIHALTGIAVVKQANGRPVTPDPQVHIYAKLNDIGDRSPAIWYPVLHLRRTAMEDTFYERKKLLDEEREKLNAGDFASQKEDSLKLMEKHAKKIFKKYDADGSGEVDLGEFLVMLRKLKLFMLPSRARKIFEYCDMERDGNLDYDQFQISLHVIQELDKHDKQSGRDGSQPLLQLLPHEAFDMMDADNDGKLDKLEFNEALRALNVVPTFSNQLDGESYLKRLWLKVLQKDLPPGEPIPMYAKIRHFEHAFLELCDVEAELKARGIRVPKNTIFGSIKHSASDNSLLNIASANTKETDEEKARRKSKWLETARKALHDHIAAEEKKERAIMQAARSQGWERKRQERIKVERVKQAQKHQAQKEANAVRLSQAEKEKSDRAAEKARRMQGAKAAKLLKTMKHEMKKQQQKRQEQETKERREEMQRRLNDDENAVIRNGWDRMDFSGQRLLEVPKEAYWYKERKEKGQEAKRLSSVRILNFSNNHLTNLPEKGFFFHLDELQKIDVSWNQITHFPAEMKECKKVQILNASNNHLTHIEESSPLSAYKHLVRLELSSNRIEIFHKHVMRNLVNLKSLEVANNALEIVPHEIRYLTNLKSLDFHGNFLHTLGKEGGFASLTAMHTLNLSNNKLESLPDDFGDLSALVDLNLGHNKLRWLPHSIGALPSLRSVNFSRNQLVQIPEEIGRLTGIICLDLSYNDLTYMPDETGGWVSLESLDISNNYLNNLPQTCGKWTSLQDLKIKCNRISSMPLEVGSWFKMEVLDFHKNKLSNVPKEIGHMIALRDLSLAHNLIETIPESISLMTSLVILNLQSNKLRGVPETIRHAKSIRDLNLSLNPTLKKLPITLGQCGQLRHLNVCSCGLSALPVELAKLTSLQTLLLTHNKINMLPVEYVNILPILLTFDISNNPLKQMPEKWNPEWNVRRETSSTGTGYSSTEAAVWIQEHSRLYPILLHVYQECLRMTANLKELDATSVDQEKKGGGGSFGGTRAKEIFAKHSNGIPPYRLPVRLNAFIAEVKAKRGVRWSEEEEVTCVHFYQHCRAQGGLPPRYEQLYEAELAELSAKKEEAMKQLTRKVEWSKSVYTELRQIAKEAYSRFLDETSLKWLEEKLRVEHAERTQVKRTAEFTALMEEVAVRKERQENRARLIEEEREYEHEQDMLKIKSDILKLKLEAVERRRVEEEREKLEQEAELRRRELLAEAACALDESSLASTESSLLSANGPFLL